MSNINLEQLAQSQKANAEVMMTLVRSAFNGMEQLAALNLAASRDFFNASVANTQQLMSVKDPKELAKINSALAQPNVNKMVDYARSVSDLAASMQKEITSVMEAQYSTFTKNASSAIDKTSASAPVGGDVFSAAMKQMLQASTKAYENMSQMAKQMTDIADANVKAASSATTKAASATAAAAKKK
jgi:phasin family protein